MCDVQAMLRSLILPGSDGKPLEGFMQQMEVTLTSWAAVWVAEEEGSLETLRMLLER